MPRPSEIDDETPVEETPTTEGLLGLPPLAIRLAAFGVVFASLGVSWLGCGIYRGRLEQAIVRQVEAAGGHVIRDYQINIKENPLRFEPKLLAVAEPPWLDQLLGVPFQSRIVCAHAGFEGFQPTLVKQIARLRHLQQLGLWNTELDASALESIARMPALREIELHWPWLTPQELEFLGRSETIESIQLHNNCATDALVAEVVHFPGLKKIMVSGPRVTGRSIAPLAECPQLQSIELRDISGISPEELRPLIDLPDLKTLALKGCGVDANAYPVLAQLPALQSLTILGANYDTNLPAIAPPIHSLEEMRLRYEGSSP
ncbi:hypothetical protein [Blastopirellula marina]|uniref:Leucine-rich repeat domain-containing protein n=1 Tax=Blastopirellula marina TaxID=124 RepID=A0A2S8GPC5_9BACT|nr:hypothetical protein [Blastopirellula marina]PQO46280.1 hypothetical protein C5Y93_09850 [Blastopirellula marina]